MLGAHMTMQKIKNKKAIATNSTAVLVIYKKVSCANRSRVSIRVAKILSKKLYNISQPPCYLV